MSLVSFASKVFYNSREYRENNDCKDNNDDIGDIVVIDKRDNYWHLH